MIKVKNMIKDLKKLEKRGTYYVNEYPYNCGYIHGNGYVSFDCIGMVKSYINFPGIVKKYAPAGFFVKTGQVIPDTTEMGIMQLCTNRSTNFKKVIPGAYLLYNGCGHGAIYVGDFKDRSGVVNVIECTTDWEANGVTTSYMDKNGGRWDHKGGTYYGQWIEWGLLTRYVDYSAVFKKEKKKKSVDIIAKEVIAGKWGNYPTRKKKLEKAGYDYEEVQARVNAILRKR